MDFIAEYAKSGRSNCRGCKSNIGQGSLRVARLVQSRFHDGKDKLWHHYGCFAKARWIPASADLIDGINSLKWDDQEKLRKACDKHGAGSSSSASGGGGGGAGASNDANGSDFQAEYAKSSRSTCRGCLDTIEQGEVRLSRLVESTSERFPGMVPAWHHVDCFLERTGAEWEVSEPRVFAGFTRLKKPDREEVAAKVAAAVAARGGSAAAAPAPAPAPAAAAATDSSGESGDGADDIREWLRGLKVGVKTCDEYIEAFAALGVTTLAGCGALTEDQLKATVKKTHVRKLLNALPDAPAADSAPAPPAGSKRKARGAAPAAKRAATDDGNPLRDQANELWELKQKLSAGCSKAHMKELLEHNDVPTHGGPDRLRERCAEILYFGCFGACPSCGEGRFKLETDAYSCRGNIDEWTPCVYRTQTPPRKRFKLPTGFAKRVEVLKGWKYTRRDRLFRGPMAAAAAAAPAPAGAAAGGPPLDGLNIALAGSLNRGRKKTELKALIAEGGGTYAAAVTGACSVVIGDDAAVDDEVDAVTRARAALVNVVNEEWLRDSVASGAAKDHRAYMLSDNLHNRKVSSGARSTMGRKTASASGKSKSVKITIHGRAAVDPESGLQDSGAVLDEGGQRVYNEVLSFTDLRSGKNSYYKLQVIALRSGGFALYRGWGRVGGSVNQHKTERMGKQAAIALFKEKFEEHTGNDWDDPAERKRKNPGKYYALDIDFGQDDDDVAALAAAAPVAAGSRSQLPAATQHFISKIFDVEALKATMLEFELDLEKMPLGKISKAQIAEAYGVLTALQDTLREDPSPARESRILGGSNRFYTLVPHDFGTRTPPLIDSLDLLKEKVQLIEALQEIEIASSLLKAGSRDAQAAGEDPIDVNYRKLGCELELLPKSDPMFQMVVQFTKNTHASTHNQYALKVKNVWRTERAGEAEAFQAKYGDLPNHQLLWHGSRTTNFSGILSQGIRIAPPEAPVTGYMFGKGAYFANAVSKSANYCRTSRATPQNPEAHIGYLLLNQVALGRPRLLKRADYNANRLPKGSHSTWGVGRTTVVGSSITIDDGLVEVPLGRLGNSRHNDTSLLYDEFITYDEQQSRMRFLVECEFQYKSRW